MFKRNRNTLYADLLSPLILMKAKTRPFTLYLVRVLLMAQGVYSAEA